MPTLQLNARDHAALQEFVRRVREELAAEVVEMKLYGSKAIGQSTPESDIDVFVVVREQSSQTESRVVDIAFDVNLEHDVYISPRVVSQQILEHPVWRITPFLQAVTRDGIVL